jgi:hypothetical protein
VTLSWRTVAGVLVAAAIATLGTGCQYLRMVREQRSARAVAPDSRFLRELHAAPLPDGLPFFLMFAYDNRARVRPVPSGDGTVVLRSQLALPVHLRARQSYGIDATHTGVLTEPTTRAIVTGLLEHDASPRVASPKVLEWLQYLLGGSVAR